MLQHLPFDINGDRPHSKAEEEEQFFIIQHHHLNFHHKITLKILI
jgi:hypothetical protein